MKKVTITNVILIAVLLMSFSTKENKSMIKTDCWNLGIFGS